VIKLENIRKIFVLGDLHLGVRNNSLEWSEIQSEFLLNFFIQKVDEEGFDPERDILVQVGDWNHVRESTNTRIYKVSLNIAKELSKKFKRGVYVILGNHDVYYKDRNDTHSLEGFDQIYPNFHVFVNPERFQINTHKFLLMPWIEDSETLKSTVSTNSWADYIFCHADFKGAVLNKATKVMHGLDKDDILRFKRVYSGHIHIRQEKENLLYVGTPYEMDRGDRGNQKGFYVLEVSQNSVEEKFIANTFSPRYVKYDILDLLNLSLPEIEQLFKNNFVDISLESEFANRFPIARFTEMVKGFGQRRLDFISYSKEMAKTSSEVEIDSNYEYNIFKVLEEHLAVSNLPEHFSKQIFEKFKSVYDLLRNNKQYE